MRQSVYLALIGAASAIRISQMAPAACTWTAAAGVGPAGCTSGTAACGSTAEQAAQPKTGAVSCDASLALAGGLSQGAAACTWSADNGVGPAGCTSGTGACGSEAEQKAQPKTGAVSCDASKAVSTGLSQGAAACTWTAAAGVGPSGCTNGTGACASAAEQAAQPKTGAVSCDASKAVPASK